MAARDRPVRIAFDPDDLAVPMVNKLTTAHGAARNRGMFNVEW